MTAALALAACEGAVRPDEDPYTYDSGSRGQSYLPEGKITGDGGLFDLFGREKKGDGGPGIGVNAYIWRGTLSTLAFMPISSADPFAGIILTDWYSPGEDPDVRFKVNVYILGTELRSDAVQVAVFQQKYDPGGRWIDLPVSEETRVNMENKILTRARQLRFAAQASAN